MGNGHFSIYSTCLLLFLYACVTSAQTSPTDSPFTSDVSSNGGLQIVTFSGQSGRIKVYLPDDIAAGDTISGTIQAQPAGKDAEERSKNLAVLASLMIDLGNGQLVPVERGLLNWKPKSLKQAVIRLVTSAGIDTGTMAAAEISLDTRSAAPSIRFSLPLLGQTGRPISISGPFDGDASNTKCLVGGNELAVIAESPRQSVCIGTTLVIGLTDIRISEGQKNAAGQFRNIGVNLRAPNTRLATGESTQLTVEVLGLQGITTPVYVQLVTTGTVTTQGGNDQRLQIDPQAVDPGGMWVRNFTLTATQKGSFDVTTNVLAPTGKKP